MDLPQFRRLYPEYDDMSDEDLSNRLYDKYYSDMDRQVFNQLLMPKEPEYQPEDKFRDNVGMFSYVADIRDRGKAITDSVDIFNQLRETPEDSPEYKKLIEDFKESNSRVEKYSEEDNWFLGMGKAYTNDILAALAGATPGIVMANPIVAAGGAGAVSFSRAREQSKVFNAYRELISSGDLTSDELRRAADAAMVQAGLESSADALTGGLAGKIGTSFLKKLALDSAVGAGTEVGSQIMQRAYVSNISVLGEGAVEEYLQAAAEGAVAQGILSTGAQLISNSVRKPEATDPEKPQVTNADIQQLREGGFLTDVVNDFKTYEDLRDQMTIIAADPQAYMERKKLEKEAKALVEKKTLGRDETDRLDEIQTKLTDIANKKFVPSKTMDDLFGDLEVQQTTREIPRFQTADAPGAVGRKRIFDVKTKKTKDKTSGKYIEREYIGSEAYIQPSKKTGKLTVEKLKAVDETDTDLLKRVVKYADELNQNVESKNKINQEEYAAWSSLKTEKNAFGVKQNKAEQDSDGNWVSIDKKKPVFEIISYPENIREPTTTVPTEITVPKAVKKPTIQREIPSDLFEAAKRRQNVEANEIHRMLELLFENDPTARFTLESMPDNALLSFAKTPQFQTLKTQFNKQKSIQLLEVAKEASDQLNSNLASDIQPAAYRPMRKSVDTLDSTSFTKSPEFDLYRMENMFRKGPEAVLDYIAETKGKNSYAGELAVKLKNKIIQLRKYGSTFDIRTDGSMQYAGGLELGNKWGVEKIVINPYYGMNSDTILHEFVHAVTHLELESVNRKLNKNPNSALFGEELDSLHRKLITIVSKKGGVPDDAISYYNLGNVNLSGLSNIEKDMVTGANNILENSHEVLAWGLTNREFAKYLDNIPYDEKTNTTFWGKLKEMLNRLFGVSKKHKTEFDNILELFNNFLDSDENALKSFPPQYSVLGSELTTRAKKLANSSGIPDSLIQKAVAGSELAKEFAKPKSEQSTHSRGAKTPFQKGVYDLLNAWPKMFVDARTLASEYPEHAEILDLARNRFNAADGLGQTMKSYIQPIRSEMQKRGVWNDRHNLLDEIRMADGVRNKDGTWLFTRGGVRMTVNGQTAKDLDALDHFYKLPLHFVAEVKNIHLQKAMKENPTLVPQIKSDIEKITKALSTPYVPHRRYGAIKFKVGEHFYSLEEIKGVDRLNQPDKINLSEKTSISRKDWSELRERIKNDTGRDVGDNPLKYFQKEVKGELDDMTLFRMTERDLNKSQFDRFIQSEEVFNLLGEADLNRLEYFKSKAKGSNTIDILLQRDRKVPGYSKDWDRVASDAYNGTHHGYINYLYESPLTEMAGKYLKNAEPVTSAERYAHHIYGPKNSALTEDLTRLQAFLGLAFSPATAALQPVSLMTTVPLNMSIMSTNPFDIVRALVDPKALRLFKERLMNRDLLGDYEKLKSHTDEEFAKFAIAHQRTLNNNPQLDYSSQGVRGRLSDKVTQVEDMGHFFMVTAEESTRLHAAYSMFNMLRNPKYLARAKDALKNDARVSHALDTRGDIPEHHILAEILMDSSFGIYGKSGWAAFQHGYGRIVFPFVSYPLQMTNVLIEHAKGARGARGQVGALMMLASMPTIFGMAGAPFWELAELIYKLFNDLAGNGKKDLNKDVFEAIYEVNPDLARFMQRGFVGSMTGVDMSRRVGLGNPFGSLISAFTEEGPIGRDVGFLLPKAAEIKDAIGTADVGRLSMAVSPVMLQNAIKAMEYGSTGVTTKRGEVIVPSDELDTSDQIKRILGFNPTDISSAQTAYYNAFTEQMKYKAPREIAVRKAYEPYKRWLKSGKTDDAARREVLEQFKSLEKKYQRNGDVMSRDELNGLTQKLQDMYLNEIAGFTGGQPKASLRKDVLEESREYYEKML